MSVSPNRKYLAPWNILALCKKAVCDFFLTEATWCLASVDCSICSVSLIVGPALGTSFDITVRLLYVDINDGSYYLELSQYLMVATVRLWVIVWAMSMSIC